MVSSTNGPEGDAKISCLLHKRGPRCNMARLLKLSHMFFTSNWEVLEMIKATITMISAVMVAGLLASGVYAAPVTLNDAQLDAVAAGGQMREAGFVCPVLSAVVGAHNPNAVAIGGGHFSVIGPAVRVPIHATNRNGDGTPPGPHAAPGDRDYTAIWGPGPQ